MIIEVNNNKSTPENKIVPLLIQINAELFYLIGWCAV